MRDVRTAATGAGPPRGADEDRRRIVYAGRRADDVARDLHPIDDWQLAMPALYPLLDGCEELVVLDPLSFPFELLRPQDWDVPLVVALPADADADAGAVTALGPAVLDRLTPYDRVTSWEDALTDRGPAPGARRAKGRHRLQHELLAAAIDDARGDARDAPLRVLELASGEPAWAGAVSPAGAHLVAPPGGRIELPDDHVDVTIAVGALHLLPVEEKRALVAELWRVTRPAGALLVVDDVVDTHAAGPPHVISTRELMELLFLATAGQLVVGELRALRYPGEPLHTGLFLALAPIGGSSAW